jgi:hypothetical protein
MMLYLSKGVMRVRRFFARLSGFQEVPPVRTLSSGNFSAHLSADGSKLFFRLVIRDIRNATQGHIHLGARGMNGPIVAFLFGPRRNPLSVRRRVITGVITREDLVGPLRGRSLRSLIRQMRLGNAYVNVHTTRNPNGQIRGQVRHRTRIF